MYDGICISNRFNEIDVLLPSYDSSVDDTIDSAIDDTIDDTDDTGDANSYDTVHCRPRRQKNLQRGGGRATAGRGGGGRGPHPHAQLLRAPISRRHHIRNSDDSGGGCRRVYSGRINHEIGQIRPPDDEFQCGWIPSAAA